MKHVIDTPLLLPRSGPSLDDLETLARETGRDLGGFVAQAIVSVTRKLFDEALGDPADLPDITTEEAILAQLEGLRRGHERHLVRFVAQIPDEDPQFADVDFAAGLLGIERDELVSLCVIAWWELQRWLLDDPQAKAAWERAQEEAAERTKIPESLDAADVAALVASLYDPDSLEDEDPRASAQP